MSAPQYQSFWPKNYKPHEEANNKSTIADAPIRWKRYAGASGNVEWQEVRLTLERIERLGCKPIWIDESIAAGSKYRVPLRKLVIEFREETNK